MVQARSSGHTPLLSGLSVWDSELVELLDASKREEGLVTIHLPSGPLKN